MTACYTVLQSCFGNFLSCVTFPKVSVNLMLRLRIQAEKVLMAYFTVKDKGSVVQVFSRLLS